MSPDNLGLFDTPPNRREVRLSLAIVGLLIGTVAIILPAQEVRLRPINAFIPIIDSIMFVTELIIATLLYAQAAVFRSRALTVLATGFALAALLLVPHLLTFPGAFTPDGLLGAGVNTTAWIYTLRRAMFPIAIIVYVYLKLAKSESRPRMAGSDESVLVWVFAALALTAAITLLATLGHDLLPSFYINSTERNLTYAGTYHFVVFALYLAATILLFLKRTSVLDMWLLVALAGWLAEAFLNLQLQARFTAGWYGLFTLMLLSNVIVMLALIAETGWLYSRLALSTASRKREHQARLMSMDAVTAAISHEVGQPLTAVNLNASAGLTWLTQERPNVQKAIESLRLIRESGQRTFDVIKSMRAMFAKEMGYKTVFSLNDLVRETASLMDRELASKKVALVLTLDEEIPPILADRVQIQRVLVNLFSNAIESFGKKRRGSRRIAIRSAQLDGDLLLEVCDSGAGIEPEEIDHIFDPFFTTKATGTGLGLTLCRTIVEEHGGKLSASPGEKFGTVFQLRLPHSGSLNA